MTNQVVEVEECWREVLDAYEILKIKHENFCKTAEGIDLDLAGPGLRDALQLLFHRRRFSMFIEDLTLTEFRRGGLSTLVPPVPQEKTEKQPSESPEKPKEEKKATPPKGFKGKKKDSPTEE